MLTRSNHNTNFKKPASDRQQRYIYQLNRLLDVARRIGNPRLIFALQQLINKRGRE